MIRHSGHTVMSRRVSRVFLRARNLRSMFQHGLPSRGKKWGQAGERSFPIIQIINARFSATKRHFYDYSKW